MAAAPNYRDGDYDIDSYIDKTASCPDGLHDHHRFVPEFVLNVRRTNSTEDISRFERYFLLAQTNQGKWFTWRHYLKILQEDMRWFDTFTVMSKVIIQNFNTPEVSEISNYITASSESELSRKKAMPFRSNKWKKTSFLRKEVGGDAESISSMDSNLSLTPQKNLLKKMCTEIRTLAHKTCKTVERISVKSKKSYCSSCGAQLGGGKAHKKCLQSYGDGTSASNQKPMIPSVIDIGGTRSMVFSSPSPDVVDQRLADAFTFSAHEETNDVVCHIKKKELHM